MGALAFLAFSVVWIVLVVRGALKKNEPVPRPHRASHQRTWTAFARRRSFHYEPGPDTELGRSFRYLQQVGVASETAQGWAARDIVNGTRRGRAILLFTLSFRDPDRKAVRHLANRNHCDEAWANVTTELQRRHDLIPELIETARASAAHERQLLTEVAALTTEAVRLTEQDDASEAHQAVEAELEAGVQRIIVRMEHQPELRADQHYLELQRQLVHTADRVQSVLRFYNGNVRAYNNSVRQFPSRIVAGLAGSKPRPYFRIADGPTDPTVRADR